MFLVHEFGFFCFQYCSGMFFDNTERQICFLFYKLDIFFWQSLPLEEDFTSISTYQWSSKKLRALFPDRLCLHSDTFFSENLFLSTQAWRSARVSRKLDFSPSISLPFGHIYKTGFSSGLFCSPGLVQLPTLFSSG